TQWPQMWSSRKTTKRTSVFRRRHGTRVTRVEPDPNSGLGEHPPWNGESAGRNHPASDGEPIRQEAASIAVPHVPADASLDPTDARKLTVRRFGRSHRSALRANERVRRLGSDACHRRGWATASL